MMEDFYGDGSRYECHGDVTTKLFGSVTCGAGPFFRDENGDLYDVNDHSRTRSSKDCKNCGSPLSREDGNLPYEDGSTAYGTIVCRNCGYENIFDFGME